jgi:aerobic-type carbon monoxide dehydrogenase small subunit (CoxS/CutS family)
MTAIRFTLNGTATEARSPPAARLTQALREEGVLQLLRHL